MIRKLLATTAIATLVASGAYAQTAPSAPAPAEAPAATETAPAAGGAQVEAAKPASDGQLASNLIGETVYNGTGDDADNIGDVNDLVIGADGSVDAIVIGVGGFLGIGEKNVALDYATIDWAERDGDRWIVVSATEEQLKELPEFDRTPYGPAPTVAANDTTAAPSTTMAPSTPAAPADSMANNNASGTTTTAPAATENNAQAPAATTDDTKTAAIDRSTLKPVDVAAIRSEELVGTTVYGANEENIGEIGDVILTQDGKVDAVIIDVGGFLGMGEKEVAVSMENLSFLADEDGDNYLYTSFTKEQLEAAAEYDKGTFAEKRDDQMIVMPRS